LAGLVFLLALGFVEGIVAQAGVGPVVRPCGYSKSLPVPVILVQKSNNAMRQETTGETVTLESVHCATFHCALPPRKP
jgi:hypothetical protein